MKFIITVDVEGDNLWGNPTQATTENSQCVPRFHNLCVSYGFHPTYLVDYEMANDTFFQQFGRETIEKREAEIGMHLHAWNTPPMSPDQRPLRDQLYITELDEESMLQKMEFMTSLLSDIFRVRPVAHRAGRWGFDNRVARTLDTLGYRVDCSVTPGVSWHHHKGDPRGNGGPDYYEFGLHPYFLDLGNIKRAGCSNILEVPVTIRPIYSKTIMRAFHTISKWSLAARGIQRFVRPNRWLKPNGHNLHDSLDLVDWALSSNLPVLQLALHSSELLPGNPFFPERADVERFYRDLETLFSHVASRQITGCTLTDYRNESNCGK